MKNEYAIDKNLLTMEWAAHSRGIVCGLCFERNSTTPVGYLFASSETTTGNKARTVWKVLDCYVPRWARRQGVMSFMMENLETYADVIITGNGSAEGGLAFLKKRGFKVEQQTGFWIKSGRK